MSRSTDLSERELRPLETLVGVKRAESGDLRVHLAYPNSYWIGMSNLGFQAVYAIFAATPGVVVERGFLPGEEAAKERSWRTFESQRMLRECDILGFSLSFETDYPHLLRMLRNQDCLHDADERLRRATEEKFGFPLIIAGGTALTLNPEPVADFVDVIVIGEAEELLSELVTVVRRVREEGGTRLDLLRALAQIEGIYVPRFYTPHFRPDGSVSEVTVEAGIPARPRRRFVADLSKFPTYSRVLTPETEFKSMFLTETGRGCEMGCRFCVAGYIYRPIRKRSEDAIADTVQIGLGQSKAIGFVGAAVSSHKSIAKLTRAVAERGARASLSSIMSQKVTPELAASISESEYKTVALAPEAGSERLRRAAGKRVTNEQVIEAARTLAESGIRGFKLYFIVGLPTERDEDVVAIAELALAVRDVVLEVSRPTGHAAWVQLSVNPFIPKASTPFQWEPMLPIKELESKIEVIHERIRRVGNIEMRFESPKESYFQGLLSRGDRRVGKLLLKAEEEGRDWKWLLQKAKRPWIAGVPTLDFYVSRHIPFEESLPWEVVDSRIDRELLKREALRARHGESYGRERDDDGASDRARGCGSVSAIQDGVGP